MIAQLAEMAYRKAGQMFFCVQKDARSVTFSYRRARFAAAALAQQLAKHGYGRGTTLACNLYNGAEIVILSLAAAYGGFTLALLNPRLSYEERKLRIVELENATGEAGIDVLEQSAVERLMIDATATAWPISPLCRKALCRMPRSSRRSPANASRHGMAKRRALSCSHRVLREPRRPRFCHGTASLVPLPRQTAFWHWKMVVAYGSWSCLCATLAASRSWCALF